MSKDGRGDDGTSWIDSDCWMSRTLAEPHSTIVQLNAYSWVLDDNERVRVRPIDVGNNKDCGEVASMMHGFGEFSGNRLTPG